MEIEPSPSASPHSRELQLCRRGVQDGHETGRGSTSDRHLIANERRPDDAFSSTNLLTRRASRAARPRSWVAATATIGRPMRAGHLTSVGLVVRGADVMFDRREERGSARAPTRTPRERARARSAKLLAPLLAVVRATPGRRPMRLRAQWRLDTAHFGSARASRRAPCIII